jgi:hypothetical protein
VLVTLGNNSSKSGLPLLVVNPKKSPVHETTIESLDELSTLGNEEKVLLIATDEQQRQDLERTHNATVVSQDAVDVVGDFSVVVDTAQWLANTPSPSGGIVHTSGYRTRVAEGKRATISKECQERNKSLVGNFGPGTYMCMHKADEQTQYPFLQLARVALRAGTEDVSLPFHKPLVFDFLRRFGLFDEEAQEDREHVYSLPLCVRCTLSLLECKDRNVGLYTAICAAVLVDMYSPKAFVRVDDYKHFQKTLADYSSTQSAKNDLRLLLLLWNSVQYEGLRMLTREFRDLVSARISLVANVLGVGKEETAELEDVEECFRELFSDSVVEKVDDAGTYATFVDGYPTAFYVLDSVLQSELRKEPPSSLVVLSSEGKWIRVALQAK